jgi:hypothetical protein
MFYSAVAYFLCCFKASAEKDEASAEAKGAVFC